MRNKTYLRNMILIILILLLPVLMSGCSGNDDQQQSAQLQAAKDKQSQEKETEKLKKIESQIENLFETLEGPSVKTDESENRNDGGQQKEDQQSGQQKEDQQSGQQKEDQQGGQQKEDQQSGQQKEDQQSGQQKEDQQGGQQKEDQQGGQQKEDQQGGQQKEDQQSGQQKTSDKWLQVGKIINNLHYQWNDLMPEISKKGADMKLVDNFDNALNSLTTTVDSRNQDTVLASANKLYSYVPDLYSLYRTKTSPEVKRMIYYTRNIILESEKDGWQQVKEDSGALEKSWSLLQNTLEREQKKTEDKLDFSIYELKKVVSEKNKQLTGIKGRIVLDNITALQKSFEEEKKSS